MDYRPGYPCASQWFENNDDGDYHASLEQDMPLDDFDRQLLARLTEQHSWQTGLTVPRLSFSSRSARLSGNEPQSLRDDLLHIRQEASSSPTTGYNISSPTPSHLQYRRVANDQTSQARRNAAPQTPQNRIIKPAPTLSTHSTAAASMVSLPHAPPLVQGIQLVETSRLPDNMKSVYKFPLFNAVQSRCFPHAYGGDNNIVLSAPTSSGKTVIMELAICRLLAAQKNKDFKVVYQAPTKSLCSERYRDWSGDVEFSNLSNVQKAHVIIATPEKWDSVTRKWKDNTRLMQMIKLFLIDEVHMLKEARGATLEAVVSRMKSIGTDVRFIALSATVPNSADVATWLGLNPTEQSRPAVCEVFGEAFRPVALEKHVIGFQGPPNDFILDSMLIKEIPGVIARYGKRKSVMIFCATRKASATQAIKLAELWKSTAQQARLWSGPRASINVMNEDLKSTVPAGVAFHHSGLDVSDRQAVENGFLYGDISVICSTSTLAVGINLPCYLVILKGTVCYSDNGLQEYSSLEVMQMLGRAGRPQFETSACAVILTNQHKVHQYEKMISGKELLESCLHQNLIEHLNAEIGIGTIHDIASAKKWLSGTFLYVRIKQNPQHYRLGDDNNFQDEDSLLDSLCSRNIILLEKTKLVENTRAGSRSTEFGDIMARYYVRYETMRVLTALPSKAKMSEILQAIAHAEEFKDLRWRVGEKTLYKQINKSNDIRYPIKVDIALPAHKALLVAQIQLGGVVLDKESTKKHSLQLKQDTIIVLSHCNRLVRCVIDMQISLEDSTAARNALELGRSLAAGVWDNTPMQLKQIDGVGEVTARKLASAGINSIDVLLNTEPHRLELVMGKPQPYGNDLLKKLTTFPNLRVAVKEIDQKQRFRKGVEIRVRCEIGHLNDRLPTHFNRKPVYVIFLCETSYGKLIEFRRFGIKRLMNGEDILLSTLLDRPTTHMSCHVMCDEIAGTHRYAELKLDLPASIFPVTTSHACRSETKLTKDVYIFDNDGDEFDDAGLDDSDFLAVETGTDHVEIVTEDIDELLACGQKRKATSDTGSVDQASDWREPKKLQNGNWTCQHTCNDDGKLCQHRCCKEGVKKPRKRPKPNPQIVINAEAAVVEPAVALKKLKSEPSTTTNKSIADILKNVSQFKREHALDGKGQKPSSILQMSVEDDLSTADQCSSTNMDLTAMLSNDQSNIKAQPVPRLPKCTQAHVTEIKEDHLKHELDLLDGLDVYDICDFDQEDFDWNVDVTRSDHASSVLHDTISKNVKQKQVTDGVPQPHDFAFPDGNHLEEFDLTQAEQTVNVSPEKLFFSEVNSSSSKCTVDLAIEQSGGDELPFDQEFYDSGAFSEADQSTLDVTADTEQNALDSKSMVPSNTSVSSAGDTSTEDAYHTSAFSNGLVPETDAQRGKRLYDEDQKKKWEGLDPILYEQFGALVELI